MAAKTIVTFHPDVACDLCGRRLLRGERPDVFLGGGQRRMVCELCTPRAAHEGWRREVVDQQVVATHAQRPPRGRSLLGRLRQLREPAPAVGHRAAAAPPPSARRARSADAARGAEWAGVESEWSGIDDRWESASAESVVGDRSNAGDEPLASELAPAPDTSAPESASEASSLLPSGVQADVRRALEIFNAGEPPRRIAGITRALGEACVRVAPAAGADGVIAIVVAWELCWYRYEIDLGDEAAGVRIAAEGMELAELAAEDRVANAVADERGALSLLAD